MKALEPSMQSVIAQIHLLFTQPDPQTQIAQLLAQQTAHLPLVLLDQWADAMRWVTYQEPEVVWTPSASWWEKKLAWLRGRPVPGTATVIKPPEQPFVPWLEMFSADGRRRKKALALAVGPAPSGLLLALALRRLNDWVPQVRAQARKSLPAIASVSGSSMVANALVATLTNWVSWGRMEEEDRQTVLDIARQPAVAQALVDRLQTASTGPMVAVLAQLCRSDALDGQLWQLAQHAMQPALRAKALRFVLEQRAVWGTGWARSVDMRNYGRPTMKRTWAERAISMPSPLPFPDLLRKGLADRSSMVRWVAAEMLVRAPEALPFEVMEVLARQLALDASPKLAERGRFVLQRSGLRA